MAIKTISNQQVRYTDAIKEPPAADFSVTGISPYAFENLIPALLPIQIVTYVGNKIGIKFKFQTIFQALVIVSLH